MKNLGAVIGVIVVHKNGSQSKEQFEVNLEITNLKSVKSETETFVKEIPNDFKDENPCVNFAISEIEINSYNGVFYDIQINGFFQHFKYLEIGDIFVFEDDFLRIFKKISSNEISETVKGNWSKAFICDNEMIRGKNSIIAIMKKHNEPYNDLKIIDDLIAEIEAIKCETPITINEEHELFQNSLNDIQTAVYNLGVEDCISKLRLRKKIINGTL